MHDDIKEECPAYDWEDIPEEFSDIRRTHQGSLWAVGNETRLKLANGRFGGSGVGRVFQGGRDTPMVQRWEVVATRPVVREYVICALGVQPDFFSGTKEYAAERLLACKRDAALYALEPVAALREIQTIKTEIVWSK